MIRTQVQLTEEQHRKLRAAASSRGASMAQLIRESVDQYLGAAPVLDPDEIRRRALEIVGRYSDAADVAIEHDRYLEEAFGSPWLSSSTRRPSTRS